jgi:hypothetical protein
VRVAVPAAASEQRSRPTRPPTRRPVPYTRRGGCLRRSNRPRTRPRTDRLNRRPSPGVACDILDAVGTADPRRYRARESASRRDRRWSPGPALPGCSRGSPAARSRTRYPDIAPGLPIASLTGAWRTLRGPLRRAIGDACSPDSGQRGRARPTPALSEALADAGTRAFRTRVSGGSAVRIVPVTDRSSSRPPQRLARASRLRSDRRSRTRRGGILGSSDLSGVCSSGVELAGLEH